MKKKFTRREALAGSFLITGASALGEVHAGSVTPAQTEGPFYPDMDNDLTQVQGAKKKPAGKFIYVHGAVYDKEGKPVERAVVEIWQTDNRGIYNHAGDPRHLERDVNFQFFGRCVTNEKGQYSFKTIKPAAYGASENWQRPPHIHYKVYRRGFEDLTTQLYFAGDPLNEKDGIYKNLPKKDRASVTVQFKPVNQIDSDLARAIADGFGQKKGLEKETFVGKFDIVINAVA